MLLLLRILSLYLFVVFGFVPLLVVGIICSVYSYIHIMKYMRFCFSFSVGCLIGCHTDNHEVAVPYLHNKIKTINFMLIPYAILSIVLLFHLFNFLLRSRLFSYLLNINTYWHEIKTSRQNVFFSSRVVFFCLIYLYLISQCFKTK